jgi:hypothetical protein
MDITLLRHTSKELPYLGLYLEGPRPDLQFNSVVAKKSAELDRPAVSTSFTFIVSFRIIEISYALVPAVHPLASEDVTAMFSPAIKFTKELLPDLASLQMTILNLDVSVGLATD